MAQMLYHMVPVAVWRQCQQEKTPYFPATYDQDGFIHLTADPLLLIPVANHFYKASAGDWILLVIDSAKLSSQVKFEPAAPVGETSSKGLLDKPEEQEQPLFPHLYGTIDFGSVVQERAMQRGEDGSFLGIEGL